MNIYVDFDDCLCETAMFFVRFTADHFGKDVPYEKMAFFDMKKSFSLTDEQYDHMMEEGHKPESLLSLEETPGAVNTVNGWIDRGYDVSIITGRPFGSFDASREWLDCHGLDRAKLYCLNKYGRDNYIKNSVFNLEIEDYLRMHFDYAVEDSPNAFKFFEHLPNLKVLVIDRPWNRDCKFPSKGYQRCHDWESIRCIVG